MLRVCPYRDPARRIESAQCEFSAEYSEPQKFTFAQTSRLEKELLMLPASSTKVRNEKPRHAWLLMIALPLLCSVQAMAQNTAGSIIGSVQDSQGAVIPGATVSALNQNQNAINATAVTN